MNNKENKPNLTSLNENVKNRLIVTYFKSIKDNHLYEYNILNGQIEGLVKDKTPLENPVLQDALKARNDIVSEITSLRNDLENNLFNKKRSQNAKSVKGTMSGLKQFAGKL